MDAVIKKFEPMQDFLIKEIRYSPSFNYVANKEEKRIYDCRSTFYTNTQPDFDLAFKEACNKIEHGTTCIWCGKDLNNAPTGFRKYLFKPEKNVYLKTGKGLHLSCYKKYLTGIAFSKGYSCVVGTIKKEFESLNKEEKQLFRI